MSTRHSRPDPTPVEQSRAVGWREARHVAESCVDAPLPAVLLPLGAALGHALADGLPALTDLPAFATSAMDGWAVAGQGPWRLVEGRVLAGTTPKPLATGRAIAIATGAPLPGGASAVVRREHGHVDDAGLLVEDGVEDDAPAHDVRRRGEECGAGDLLLPSGTVVTPPVLGLAAAAGHDRLLVHRRPIVEILVLGDELLEAGPPRDGLIRDALGPMLAGWLPGIGADVVGVTRIADDPRPLQRALRRSTADLVLTTGSTSAGPADFLHGVLRECGGRLLVGSVAVRPGHPMLLASLPGPRRRLVVGLPGNPLAAVAGLLTLAAPVVRALAGHTASSPRHAVATAPIPAPSSATRLVPVVAGPAGVGPLRFDGPAMLRGLSLADALAVVPPGGVATGETVELLDLPR